MLCILDLDPLLQRVTIDEFLDATLLLKPLLLRPKVVLVHRFQVTGLVLLLGLLPLHVIIVVFHLRAEQLFTLYAFHFDHVLFASLLIRNSIDPGGLLLHALQRLFVLCVRFVTGHLVDQVLDALLLESLLTLGLLGLACLHVQLLVKVGSLHVSFALLLRSFI